MVLVQIPITYKVECPPTIRKPEVWNKITLIGEAPGRDELSWNECANCGRGANRASFCCGAVMRPKPQGFVGGSGNMLARALDQAGIDFQKCNRTNVVKRRPLNNDFSGFYHDPKERTRPTDELKWWQALLIKELTLYRPNVVVAVGDEAMYALTGERGITKYMGSLLLSNVISGLKVIPIVHTAYIMRDNWDEYYVIIRHLKKVAAEALAIGISNKEPDNEFTINPTLDQVLEWLDHIRTSSRPWYLDVETKGDTLVCFGLFSELRPGRALCVPIQRTTGPAYSPEQEAFIFVALSKAMAENKLLRNQNIMYDLDYMADYLCEPSGVDFDPMLAMNVAYPEFAKGLDYTCALFTSYKYYKDEGKTWKKATPDDKVFVYNCKDMVVTPAVSDQLANDLNTQKLLGVYQRRTNALIPIGFEMQRTKLRLHREWFSTLSTILAEAEKEVHAKLVEKVGYGINAKSSPQIQKLLYDELKLPIKYKRATGKPTVDENTLKEIRAGNPNIEVLNLILEERHLRTKQSNYINVAFDNTSSTGELYLSYQTNIGGTKTGRWSFSTSPKWIGGSPQVIPKVMRLMYQPHKQGECFWQRDLSQAEARIVAWLSECQFLIDTFNSPIKIHKVVAGRIFGKDPTAIISDTPEYDIAKRIVHGYNYMMAYRKIAIIAHVAFDFAQRAYIEYGKSTREITAWHKFIKETVIKTGRLVTPMGRVRQCYKACGALVNTGQLPDEILRDLVSYIPQSTVPDVLNEGMVEVWQKLPWVKWHQQGHDSYLCSGPAERTQEVYETAEQAASKVKIPIAGNQYNIPGEFQWGYLWGAMVSYKPGEPTDYDSWKSRAEAEGLLDLDKIKTKLISMF